MATESGTTSTDSTVKKFIILVEAIFQISRPFTDPETGASSQKLVIETYTEQFEHDEEGRLLKHTDTKGLATQYHYNTVGLLEQRIDANRHQIGYHWDKQGRIQKLINQNHAEYLFGYNRFGQLVHEQAFDGEEKHYSYNDNVNSKCNIY